MDGISNEDGATAVKRARNVLQENIAGETMPELSMPPSFSEKRGVFVTLTRNGELRGCIGYPTPMLPLSEGIEEAALSAALDDPRFPPVTADELPDISIEVTVLTPPILVSSPPSERPEAVMVGKHGLIIAGYGRRGLLLPQVAVEYHWDARTFLDQVCIKAGLPPGTWRKDDTELYTFEGQIFYEEEHT
ncbi:TIGR00296 family protein [Methanogenium organophilum]|uniref:Protein OU421_11420 n=1 Tax=Methanogenium organophilum TaxID=2199 RepID=A0A9X9T7E9_METOG|nr:TIGR00296 family protein [Methanogenium organophilum]WAI01014.1 TIGR00296 family protein [Methanogenium organophilum]